MAHSLDHTHPVTAAVTEIHGVLDEVTDTAMWTLQAPETGAALVELARAKARLVELETRVLEHAHTVEVGADVGSSSPEVWVANESRQTRAEVFRLKKLTEDLQGHPRVREALADAAVLPDQARVIAAAVDELPNDLDPSLIVEAEEHLIQLAGELDAKALKIAGDKILAVVAPDIADAHEARLLERAERRAAAKTRLSMHRDGQGMVHGRFAIPELHGDALEKALYAFAAPKHLNSQDLSAEEKQALAQRPGPVKLGHAFCELIETLRSDQLPDTGGVSATMVVTLDFQTLTGQIEKAGVLDTGQRISPSTARRLACEAGIIPAVLDGASQPLDLGMKRRQFSPQQRIALTIQQGGTCAAEGCDRTRGLHAHHLKPWSRGGPTDLSNAVAVCHWHHMRCHDGRYDLTRLPDGSLRFHRRT